MVMPLICGQALRMSGEGVVAVLGVGLGCKTDDVVVGVGAVGPLVGVGPDAELEVDAAACGFGGDELEGVEIALAFAGLECGFDVDAFVAGNLDEVGVGEVEIVVGDAAGEVVGEAEGEGEAVEARGGEGVEVGGPEGAVVEPGLVFDFGAEAAGDAADFVGGGFDDRGGEMESENGGSLGADAVGELEEAVDEAAGDRWR